MGQIMETKNKCGISKSDGEGETKTRNKKVQENQRITATQVPVDEKCGVTIMVTTACDNYR